MKIQHHSFVQRDERGMATIVFIALLAIMMILVAVNGRALFRLHREVKLLEQQQIKRFNVSGTNSFTITHSESK